MANYNGIINLKKEAGMTSHDAVFKTRKILGEKKIGHGGTLDPDVTGVLPIAVGQATRVIEYMTEAGKVYEGEITIGFSTSTEDASGEVIEERPVDPETLTTEKIDQAMAEFVGEITQIPPMYSAVRVNGKRLYEYARAGETVERPQRKVTIAHFERLTEPIFENNLCRFDFKVKCSKGTYVRTLSVDLGEKLGYPSHMSRLVRTSSAGLHLADAYSLSDIEQLVSQKDNSFLLPIEYGVQDLPKIDISEMEKEDLSHGRFIKINHTEPLLAAFYDDELVAVIEKRDTGYKPRKVFKNT